MLNNTISHYEAQNTNEEISEQILVDSEPYYHYLLDSENTFSNGEKINYCRNLFI